LERVVVSPDGRGFVLAPSRRPFHPWGLNYGNAGRLVEDFWDRDWERLAGDFRELISSNTLEELDALERAGQLTIEQALWREWLRLFVRLGPELAPRLSPSRRHAAYCS